MGDCPARCRELPINPDFLKKYPVVGDHAGHAVRGEVKPPENLGFTAILWLLTMTVAMETVCAFLFVQ